MSFSFCSQKKLVMLIEVLNNKKITQPLNLYIVYRCIHNDLYVIHVMHIIYTVKCTLQRVKHISLHLLIMPDIWSDFILNYPFEFLFKKF